MNYINNTAADTAQYEYDTAAPTTSADVLCGQVNAHMASFSEADGDPFAGYVECGAIIAHWEAQQRREPTHYHPRKRGRNAAHKYGKSQAGVIPRRRNGRYVRFRDRGRFGETGE